jgi:ERF superfamily.
MADDMMGGQFRPQTMTTWSAERSALAKAMAKAQGELGPVLKDKTNPAFRSKYADLGAVLEAILPALNRAGLSLIQSPSYDGSLVGVTTVLLHESGEWMEATLHMKPVKMDPQGIGSCITYARRYAALAIAGAAPEDDDGNAASAALDRGQRVVKVDVGPVDMPSGMTNRDAKDLHGKLTRGIDNCGSLDALKSWSNAWREQLDELPEDYAEDLRGQYARKRDELKAVEA